MFGALLAWLPFATLRNRAGSSYFAMLLTLCLGLSIALFGLGMASQSALDRPTSRSFFIRWLLHFGAKRTPAGAMIAASTLAIAALLLGVAIDSKSEVDFGCNLFVMLSTLHLQILFHELGHWYASRAVGYRPFRVVGGAFGWVRRGAGWRMYLNRDWRFVLGGAVHYTPSERVRTRLRDAAAIGGGPLASLVLFLVFDSLSRHAPGVGWVDDFVRANLASSVAVLALNLYPHRMFGTELPSDGYQLLQLFRN